jgi:NADPH:quinone reductase
MKRVAVDHFGGPEVLGMVEEDDPRAGPGEVRVRVLAAGVSFTDAQLRAGTYIPGGPKPPFTPGYELVGVVEELGADCSRLRVGDRIGALTVWGADADRVCVPEASAVEVPEDLDPAEVLGLLFPYMTAYQVLHRAAMAKGGETVLVHGAAGRVGTAVLELGAVAGLRLYGTASPRDQAAVERLGAVAIDYRNEDFLARVRELTGDGVDVVLDSLGGPLSLRSFRALRPGGRLVVFGRYATLQEGRKDWPKVIEWYAAIGALWLGRSFRPAGGCSPTRSRSSATLLKTDPEQWAESPGIRSGSGRTSEPCSSCFVVARSTPSSPSACRLLMPDARTRCSSVRRREENSCSCRKATRTPADGARRPALPLRAKSDTAAFTRKQKSAMSLRTPKGPTRFHVNLVR